MERTPPFAAQINLLMISVTFAVGGKSDVYSDQPLSPSIEYPRPRLSGAEKFKLSSLDATEKRVTFLRGWPMILKTKTCSQRFLFVQLLSGEPTNYKLEMRKPQGCK